MMTKSTFMPYGRDAATQTYSIHVRFQHIPTAQRIPGTVEQMRDMGLSVNQLAGYLSKAIKRLIGCLRDE